MENEISTRAVQYFERLASISSSPIGVTRLPFSRENDQCIRYLQQSLNSLGKRVFIDSMGNVFSSDREDHSSVSQKTYFVSHYDSVPRGGRYDGIAGIVFGLILLEHLKPDARKKIDLIAFNCEESSLFGQASVGSKVFFEGPDCVDDLQTRIGKRDRLSSLIHKSQYSSLSQGDKPKIPYHSHFYEIHVDQSQALFNAQSMVGIVNTIAGQIRISLGFHGETGHSSLMDHSKRKDSLLAASRAVMKVRELVETYGPENVVGTVTQIENKPNVINMIPGNTELTVDIRGFDNSLLKAYHRDFQDWCNQTFGNTGIDVQSTMVSQQKVAIMDSDHGLLLQEALKEKGISSIFMPCMSWHDIAEVSHYYPVNLLLIPNESGVSHSPKESLDLSVFSKLIGFFSTYFGGHHVIDSKCSHS